MPRGRGSSGAGAVQVGPCGQTWVSPLLMLVAPRPERCCGVVIALELDITKGQRIPAGQLSKPTAHLYKHPNNPGELQERPTPGIRGRDKLAATATGPQHRLTGDVVAQALGRAAVEEPERGPRSCHSSKAGLARPVPAASERQLSPGSRRDMRVPVQPWVLGLSPMTGARPLGPWPGARGVCGASQEGHSGPA